jgi:pimeloyl-ACP methyl ester carboxylesterase
MKFVSILEHQLAYEEFPGAEPTLVLLHEGLGSIRMWRDFPERLAKETGRRVVVYDRYGYGDSDILQEPRVGVLYMHDEALKVLPAFLEALHIESPVLVGHSDGASISLIHAGAGFSVRGVIVLAPHVFVEEVSIKSIQQAKTSFETTDFSARLAKYHKDVKKTFYLWNNIWLDPDFFFWNIEEFLPQITAPVLVIQGEDDEYGTSSQIKAIQRQAGGRCEAHLLPQCKHSPHRDQPEQVIALMREFVASLGLRDHTAR